MSRKLILKTVHKTNKNQGGSTLTKVARSTILIQVFDDLQLKLNIQVKDFNTLKIKHIKSLVEYWKAQDIKDRTIQNRLAAVRSALREVGRDEFADCEDFSNRAFGVSGASRNGTHRPPDKQLLVDRLLALPQEAQILANLQITLGLRLREAVQCGLSLGAWENQLNRGNRISVIHGTKGGRPRDVVIRPDHFESVKATIANAKTYLIKNERTELIDSVSLMGAVRAYERALKAVGFVGPEASHSFRVGFARDQYQYHFQDTGGDRNEALARLSLDLGHGDGRGRYCAQVYLRDPDPD